MRRIKKAKPLIKQRNKKKKHVKTQLPTEITTQKPDIMKKLGIE